MPPIGRIANPQLTREQVESILVLPLMQENKFLAAGPRMFDSDGSQIRVPKLVGTTGPGWHAENEQITEAQATFDSVILLPPTLKSVKVLVPMSNEILRQSVIALEAALRDRLVYDVSRALDYGFFQGSGAADANGNKVPLGMLNWPGNANELQTVTVTGAPTGGSFTVSFGGQTTAPIAWNANAAAVLTALQALNTIGVGNIATGGGALPGTPVTVTFQNQLANNDQPLMTALGSFTGGTAPAVAVTETTKGVNGVQSIDLTGTPVTLDNLHDAIGMAMAGFSDPNRWFMTPRAFTGIRKLKDAYSRYQLQPDPKAENQFQLFGIPVTVTNHMAPNATTSGPSTIALTDMNQIACGRDLEPNVRVLDQTRADKDQTLIRVVTRYDCAPLNGPATVLLKNAG